jgi:hypothetical protein
MGSIISFYYLLIKLSVQLTLLDDNVNAFHVINLKHVQVRYMRSVGKLALVWSQRRTGVNHKFTSRQPSLYIWEVINPNNISRCTFN